jgi:hypothetical protein
MPKGVPSMNSQYTIPTHADIFPTSGFYDNDRHWVTVEALPHTIPDEGLVIVVSGFTHKVDEEDLIQLVTDDSSEDGLCLDVEMLFPAKKAGTIFARVARSRERAVPYDERPQLKKDGRLG